MLSKNRIPMRRCIGCRKSKEKTMLLRFTLENRKIIMDFEGNKDGRGSYLCRNEKCLDKAIKKKAFEREFSKPISDEQNKEIINEIKKIK